MTITVYRSTDVSAPTLNGEIGSMITVLDAILVNGYGTQPAAGWTKAYSDTNLAAYRMSTTSPATGMYLRVDDTGTTAARVVGYKTMSNINTGTGVFPTTAQLSGGLFLRKSNTANTTSRPWMAIACERGFYFWTFGNSTTFGTNSVEDGLLYFGDFSSYKTVNNNNCLITGNIQNTGSSGNTFAQMQTASYTGTQYLWLAKNYTGLADSQVALKVRRMPSSLATGSGTLGASTSSVYPDPVTGNLTLFKIDLLEGPGNVNFSGSFPGLYEPHGGTNVGNIFDTFTGTGTLSGINFILMPIYNSTTLGRGAFQISGDWYS
jgi:hypothetical protein